MQLIDFNDNKFTGFEDGEDVLLDTSILLAYLNEYDAWHTTVKKLFENHILGNDKVMFLYVNPTIINEVQHLGKEPLKQYLKKHPDIQIDEQESDRVKTAITNTLDILVENDVLNILAGNKDSVLKQIKLAEKLGAADSVHASIANEYGINFLTLDAKLTNNIREVQSELKDIPKMYTTYGRHKDY